MGRGLTRYQVPSQRTVCHFPDGAWGHAVPWLWGPRHRSAPLPRWWVLGGLLRHMASRALREALSEEASTSHHSCRGPWLEERSFLPCSPVHADLLSSLGRCTLCGPAASGARVFAIPSPAGGLHAVGIDTRPAEGSRRGFTGAYAPAQGQQRKGRRPQADSPWGGREGFFKNQVGRGVEVRVFLALAYSACFSIHCMSQ